MSCSWWKATHSGVELLPPEPTLDVVALGSQEGEGHVDALDFAGPILCFGAGTAFDQVGFEFVEPGAHCGVDVQHQEPDTGIGYTMLRTEPSRLPLLHELEHNLVERITEAQQRTWLGEVEGLRRTLTALREKTEHAEQLVASGLTDTPRPLS